MGSIQWKRGSVRGVPPQNYQWAIEPPDNDETADNWKATALIIAVGTLVYFIFGVFFWLMDIIFGENS